MDKKFVEDEVIRISEEQTKNFIDYIAEEKPVTIYLNNHEFVTLMCTPEKLDYLTLGFLRSEGLIKDREDVLLLEVDKEKGMVKVDTREPGRLAEKLFGKRTITSGCGKGSIFFNVLDSLTCKPMENRIHLSPAEAIHLMKELHQRADLFKQTGGVHSSAIASEDKGILFFCEDIGRHNAVDKLVGECLAKDVMLEDKILLTTGRLSSEILLKSAKTGISILLSRSAPTSLSVELAKKLGVTMIGFVRGRRMNVYSHEWRIM